MSGGRIVRAVAKHKPLFHQRTILAHSLSFVATIEVTAEAEKTTLEQPKRGLAALEAEKGEKAQREVVDRVCHIGVHALVLVDGGNLQERPRKERQGKWRRPDCTRPTSQRNGPHLASNKIVPHQAVKHVCCLEQDRRRRHGVLKRKMSR